MKLRVTRLLETVEARKHVVLVRADIDRKHNRSIGERLLLAPPTDVRYTDLPTRGDLREAIRTHEENVAVRR